ncbi:sensor histidine kinase [Actinomyces vulturis]|uniref:sensor histidine kinase n=1 Tax=Actinomyces vulturis TaxID=1857645 RepID=UPI000831F34F|nr:ATP-binding protein [Actinomyces vulturis]
MNSRIFQDELGVERSVRLMVFIAFSSLTVFYYLVEAPAFMTQILNLPAPVLFGVVLPFLVAPLIPLVTGLFLLAMKKRGIRGETVDWGVRLSGWFYIIVYAACGLMTFVVHDYWPGLFLLPRIEGMHVVTTLALGAPIGMCAVISSMGITVVVSLALSVLQLFIRIHVTNESIIEALLEGNTSLLLGGMYAMALMWILNRAAEIDDHDITMTADRTSMLVLGEVMASRRRVGAIVHDHIIAALVAARQDLHVDRLTISQTAQGALTWMIPQSRVSEQRAASFASSQNSAVDHGLNDSDSGRTAHDCADYLRGWIDSHSDTSISFTLRRDIHTNVTLPSNVWHDVISASTEALRNVQRHALGKRSEAYSPLLCRIVVTTRQHGITITIDDNGVGFNLHDIDPNHFGVRQSILERMDVLPGGRAQIVTAPGEGTRVHVSWDEEPVSATMRLVPRRYLPLIHRDMSNVVETLSGRIGVSVFLAFMWFHALLRESHFSFDSWQAPSPTIVAAALYTAAFMAASERGDNFLTRHQGWICVGVSAIVPGMLMAARSVDGPIGNDGWIASYGVLLAALLIIRGRDVLALSVFVLQMMSFGSGLASQGEKSATVQWWVIHQSINLLNVWVCMIVVGVTEQRLVSRRQRAVTIDTQRRAQAADALAWTRLHTAVMKEVRPVMEYLAGNEPVTDEIRHRSAQLEIHLRDCLRSPRLALDDDLRPVVKDARVRGISVELIDDSGSRQAAEPPALPAGLLPNAIEVLQQAGEGDRVTIRLLPDRNPWGAAVSSTSAQPEERADVYELIERDEQNTDEDIREGQASMAH